MKKLYYLIVLALILGLVLTGCSLLSNISQVPTTGQSGITYLTKHTEDAPFVTDLIADGGDETSAIIVGVVKVWNDGDNLYVKYVITDPDWCLTETHLQVATTLAGIPQNKKDNPIPGHFEENYKYDCVSEVLYTYDLAEKGWSSDDLLYIAAHAVVSSQPIGESETILYGSQRDTLDDNGLYRIDLEMGTATPLFDTGETDKNSPNALGYDPVNRRLYYMKYSTSGPSVLYFYDIVGGMEYAAGLSLEQVVVGASFYDGAYYYIPDNTADLYKVNLYADGHVSNHGLVWGNFNGSNVAVYHFGDFAIDEYGMLYASTGSTAEFFELNVVTGEYKLITNSPGAALGVQVSFGSDGTLYGHAAGNGEFFEINLTNGSMLSIGYVASDEREHELFSDLASGEFFVPITETAWADGTRFTEPGNWATYFTYTIPLHQIEVFAVSSIPVEKVLDTGDYKFVVSGIANAGDTIDFDAKYSITNRIAGDTWTDKVSGYEYLGVELLDLFVNGAPVNWGLYNEEHIYEYLLTGWTVGAVTFCIYDTYPINNLGHLIVEIYKLP